MIILAPVPRRIVYVTIYELLAIVLSTILLMSMSGGEAAESVPVAIAISVIAVVWNYVFNSVFEFWERVSGRPTRTVGTRVLHATLFETGLVLFTIPIYMWWYNVGPLRALAMEATILLFFLAYTFLFTWAFDLVFARTQQNQHFTGQDSLQS